MEDEYSGKERLLEVVTLAPEYTDAASLAYNLTDGVILKSNFREAMEYGLTNNKLVLISCGFVDRNVDGVITDCWVDLHFDYINKMKIVDVLCQNTKEMCLARRKDLTSDIETAIIHPSTSVLLKQFVKGVNVHFVNNKPTAVKAVNDGKYDACIGSVDYARQFSNVEILERFQPQMVWVLYQRNEDI